MIPLMFLVKDVCFPEIFWSKNWPRPQRLTVVAKFLSPDREIVSRFGDCLPFGDMSLAVNSKINILSLGW